MLKALLRVLKSEKYGSLLLLILFIFNSAVFLKISGDEYQPSTGAANLLCIAPAEQSSTCAPMNCGVGGNIVNQLLNGGYLSAQSYSAIRGDCSGASANGRSLQEYFETVAQEDTKKFSLSNTLGDINTQVLAQRPASAAIYVQDKVYALTNFNKVSAQSADYEYYSPGGTGFSLLRPIQNFWSWAVRVVYGFLLLIVIIIAFAIMFRQRLSGNVEVTIQSAIPSIALAMILVPLSYAISGLFIDVITVGTNMVHSFLIGAPGSPGHELFLNAPNIQSYTLLGEPETVEDRGFYPDDVRVDWLRARNNLNAKGAITDAAEGIGDATILPLVDAFVKIIANGSGVSDLSFTWVGDLVQFFISIVSIWIAIQVFIALIKKYLVLITYPIISPFIFATVAIPGNGTKSIMQYAKVMMAASLAFIVTYAMFLLSIIFTSTYFQNDIPAGSTAAFSPPLLGLGTLGLTSGDTTITKLLLTLIGLGIYFSIPNTLKSIDKALGADQPLPKFITTPIESFNESRKVMFNTAPALVGRTALTGGRLAKNAGLAVPRGYTATRDTLDRLRGIDPEKDYRSYRNRQRASLQDRRENNQFLRDKALGNKNPLARMAGVAGASLGEGAAALQGSIMGTGSKLPTDTNKPKVELKEESKRIQISRSDILTFINAAGLIYTPPRRGPGGSVNGTITAPAGVDLHNHEKVVLASGTLEFSITGNNNILLPPFTADYAPVINPKVGSVTNPNVKVFDEGRIIPDPDMFAFANFEYKDSSGGKSNIAPQSYGGPIVPNRIISITLNDKGKPRVKGDSASVEYLVVTTDLPGLIGTTLNPSNYAPIDATAILKPGTGNAITTEDRSVRFNGNKDFTSKPFSLSISLT